MGIYNKGVADTSLYNLTATGNDKIASAWVNFNGTGTVAIRNSFNVSSITDGGVGIQFVNFTTAMARSDYVAAVNAGAQSGWIVQNKLAVDGFATSNARIVYFENGVLTDNDLISVIFFGGL